MRSDIRQLSKAAGLFTWNKPAYACLAASVKDSPLTFPTLSARRTHQGYRPALGFSDFRVRTKGKRNKIKGGLSPLFEDRVMLEPETREEGKY